MSDNPQVFREAPFPLGFGVLALAGPDATKFAHAQFMSDVAALADGRWQWSGWLTPKGRVIALFALVKLDAQALWLLLPDADAATLAAQLRRYLFRSKVAVEARTDLLAAGAFAAPARARGAAIEGSATDGIELDFGADGGARTVRIAPASASSDPAHDDARARDAWRGFDLAHGLPRLDAGQADRWTPQQLSLDRLRAYSVKKGCYPGQEIVARTHFLGQAKRGLVLLAADAPLAPGMPLRAGDASLGELVSVAREGAGWRALAVATAGAAQDDALAAGGVPVAPLPLRGGLARHAGQ